MAEQQPIQTYLPVVCVVLDGFGVAPPGRGNAITLANTPNINTFIRDYPVVTLQASGEVVGLPWAEMGNSEVGHLNIGGGKVIFQNFPMINRAIADGSFYTNPAFEKAMAHLKKTNGKLHLLGLLSPGGIHSTQDHLYALLEYCRSRGFKDKVFIHGILDGRDTPKNSAAQYLSMLQNKLKSNGFGKIATLSGRFWAMDRDNRWDRIEKAWKAMVQGESQWKSDDPAKALEGSYQRQEFDEQVVPMVMTENGQPVAKVEEGDAVIFFNFRADRARELTKAFVLPGFQKFDRPYTKNLLFVTLTEYETNLPVTVAFQPDVVKTPVAKVVSDAGYKQLHIAETEKYAHVTFFFNGGTEEQFPGEDRVLIPSPRVTSYDQQPAMSAVEITDRLLEEIDKKIYQFVVVNFANADMVGHTGNLPATTQAIQALDTQLGRIAEKVLSYQGTLVITADHGNAEEMLKVQTGEIDKEHSINPVPFFIVNQWWAQAKPYWPPVAGGDLSQLRPLGILSDVGPTLLRLMGLTVPPDMSGHSIV